MFNGSCIAANLLLSGKLTGPIKNGVIIPMFNGSDYTKKPVKIEYKTKHFLDWQSAEVYGFAGYISQTDGKNYFNNVCFWGKLGDMVSIPEGSRIKMGDKYYIVKYDDKFLEYDFKTLFALAQLD